MDSTSSAINTLFETAKTDTLVLLKDAVCAVKSEKEVAVRALEGKNYERRQNLLNANRLYREGLTQLRQHNTLLAGQVRALQDHINGQCSCPLIITSITVL